jgi:hypothetical protein
MSDECCRPPDTMYYVGNINELPANISTNLKDLMEKHGLKVIRPEDKVCLATGTTGNLYLCFTKTWEKDA